MAAVTGNDACSAVPTVGDCGCVDAACHGAVRGGPARANVLATDADHPPWTVRPLLGGDPCPWNGDGHRVPLSGTGSDPCCGGATSPCDDARATWTGPCGCCAFRRRDRGCGAWTTCLLDGGDRVPCGLRWTCRFQPSVIRPPSCTEPRASPRRRNLQPPSCFSSSSSSSSTSVKIRLYCRFTGTSSVNSTCRKCRRRWGTLERCRKPNGRRFRAGFSRFSLRFQCDV